MTGYRDSDCLKPRNIRLKTDKKKRICQNLNWHILFCINRLRYLSVDDVEAGVFAEHFGHYDAFGCLVVFKYSCHDTRKGESGAV